MQFTMTVTEAQVSDLFVTAVEGGCADWCSEMSFQDGSGKRKALTEAGIPLVETPAKFDRASIEVAISELHSDLRPD